jgi:alpha-D-xyloside xylohydrolase
VKGKQTIAVNAPIDRVPLYVRSGTVLPKIPDDIMTLVPAGEFANKNVKSLDDRRVYEMYSGNAKVRMRDFEDRTLDRDENSFAIAGKAAHVILRWRFNAPRTVSVDGRALTLVSGANGERTVEFEHRDKSTVRWE